MANKQQIKHVLIDINTKGAAEVTTAVKAINTELENIQDNSVRVGGFLKGPIKSLETLISRTQSLNTTFESAAKGAQSINRAMTGDAKATQRIEGYIVNLEVVTLVLKDMAKQANITNTALGNMSETSGMTSMVKLLKDIETNTGKAASRIRQTRKAIVDLDFTTNEMSEEFQEFAHETNNATKAQGKFNKRSKETQVNLTNMTKSGNGATKSFSKMAFGMNPLTSMYASIAINVYAATEAFRVLSDAANLDRLINSTASFSAGVSGLNIPRLAKQMNELSGSILSVKDSMNFATKGAAFDFTADQLGRLAEGARKSSIALGINFSDAMDRVLRGISKQEIELFDELGIVTRLTPAFKAYAETVGKTIDQLSDYERQLALTNEVQRQLDERFAGIQVKSTVYEKLAVNAANFKDQLMIAVASGLEPMVGALANILDISDTLKDSQDQLAQSMKTMTDAARSDSLGIMITAYSELSLSLRDARKEIDQMAPPMSESNIVMKGIARAGYAAGAAVVVMSLAMGAAGGSTTFMTAALAKLSGALAFATGGFNALTAAMLKNPITAGLIALLAVATAAYVAYSSAVNDAADAEEKRAESLKKVNEAAAQKSVANEAIQATGVDITAVRLLAEKHYIIEKYKINFAFNEKTVHLNKERLTKEEKAEKAHLLAIKNVKLKNLGEIEDYKDKAVALDAARIKASEKSILKGRSDLSVLSQKAATGGSALTETLTAARKLSEIATNVGSDSEITALVDKQKLAFKDLYSEIASRGLVPWDDEIKTADQLTAAIEKAHNSLKEIAQTRTMSGVTSKRQGEDTTDTLFRQISIQANFIDSQTKIGGLNTDLLKKENDKLEVMTAQYVNLYNQRTVMQQIKKLNDDSSIQQAKNAEFAVKESTLLKQKKELVSKTFDAQIALVGIENTAEQNRLKAEKKLQLELLDIKSHAIKRTEKYEASLLRLQKTASDTARSSQQAATVSSAFGQTTKVGTDNAAIANMRAEIAVLEETKNRLNTGDGAGSFIGTDEEIQANALALANMNAQLKTTEGLLGMSAIADFSAEVGRMKELVSGWDLSPLQNTFINTFETVDNSIGKMTEAFKLTKEGLAQLETGSVGPLDGLKFGFSSLWQNISEGSESLNENQKFAVQETVKSISAVGQVGLQLFQDISAGKVAGYDREIAAEQKRDGKSKESVAKIKGLNIKKIKEEAKAKKASVGMSTAVAVMGQLAMQPVGPWNYALAGIMAASGVMQMANIDKAASGQLASLSAPSGPSAMSITGGNRDNSMDVSKSANAGEFAFLGGSGSTPGRAGGGYSEAGASIIVGERGPEMITPQVPVNVATAGESTKQAGPSIVFSPSISIDAMDGQSILDRSPEIFDAFEQEFNARFSKSVENL
jgi:hypothetical protein